MRTALRMRGQEGGQEGGFRVVFIRPMCKDSFSPTFRSTRTRVRAVSWLVIDIWREGRLNELWSLVYLKLALNILLLFATQILQPVAGQASPAPTPCRGAKIVANKIKEGYIFREGLSPPLDPGLARTLEKLHYEGKKSATWSNSSQSLIAFDHGSSLLTWFLTTQPRFPTTAK